jgi:hypothetical protein
MSELPYQQALPSYRTFFEIVQRFLIRYILFGIQTLSLVWYQLVSQNTLWAVGWRNLHIIYLEYYQCKTALTYYPALTNENLYASTF